MKKITENLTEIIISMMDQNNISKYSLEKNYSPKSQYPTNVVPANKRVPPLEGGHSTKTGGMCKLKHDIISPKFYELLIKIELTMIWNSITSTTTSICLSMERLDSKNTLFLITSISKDTLILKKNLYQVIITLPILGIIIHTLLFYTYYWLQWLMKPV